VLISDILRSKGSAVTTIEPDATLESLVQLLAGERIGAAVVSGDGRTLEGIVSERDVVRALSQLGAGALSTPVRDICTNQVTVAAPSDRLETLAAVMTAGRFRHVPIVVDGQIQGIVSIGDVVKGRMSELESEKQALAGYITSGG
jgi:CBS domain-containing protein